MWSSRLPVHTEHDWLHQCNDWQNSVIFPVTCQSSTGSCRSCRMTAQPESASPHQLRMICLWGAEGEVLWDSWVSLGHALESRSLNNLLISQIRKAKTLTYSPFSRQQESKEICHFFSINNLKEKYSIKKYKLTIFTRCYFPTQAPLYPAPNTKVIFCASAVWSLRLIQLLSNCFVYK